MCGTAVAVAIVLAGNFFFLFVYFDDKNGLLKFWDLPNFEALSHGPGLTTGRGREKSGESEENRERDVEADTCHVCIEREKKIFAIVNSTECSCCCLCCLENKNVFVYFNDSRVYREREKNLVKFPITSNCAALQLLLLLCWLKKKKFICIF